jgi:DNA-binding transcriptional ArsR family regulator
MRTGRGDRSPAHERHGQQREDAVNPELHARLAVRARILKALAHPTRLFIVHELERAERCVADLTGLIGADMSTVSKHLSILRAAGIVADEKRGAQVYYTLRVPCIMGFFGCIEAVIRERAAEQTRATRAPRIGQGRARATVRRSETR